MVDYTVKGLPFLELPALLDHSPQTRVVIVVPVTHTFEYMMPAFLRELFTTPAGTSDGVTYFTHVFHLPVLMLKLRNSAFSFFNS